MNRIDKAIAGCNEAVDRALIENKAEPVFSPSDRMKAITLLQEVCILMTGVKDATSHS